MRVSDNRWSTAECGLCGAMHQSYASMIDKDGIEYVQCGYTRERIDLNVNTGEQYWCKIWTMDIEKPLPKDLSLAGILVSWKLSRIKKVVLWMLSKFDLWGLISLCAGVDLVMVIILLTYVLGK